MNTKTLTFLFQNKLAFDDIPKFRGAVIDAIKAEYGDVSILFHNHLDSGFRFRYPLIQYKQIDGRAAIVCIGNGIDEIGKLLASNGKVLTINHSPISMEVDKIIAGEISFDVTDNKTKYHLSRWLPLNKTNYEAFRGIDALAGRISFLEKILCANILSMAKGIGLQVEGTISCTINRMSEPRLLMSKNVKMMAFDVDFCTNISLDNFIGLGKHVSTGFGIITKS